MNIAKYNKFWVALTIPLGVLLFVMSPADGQVAFQVTLNEWYMVLVALAGAVGVRQVPNK
jgi:hypothetical protein